ncbi:hypothetical protein S40288_01015 [Stachybotrys chartarum IBT 40288]|nr:hypothetical protein S40288_01015 [Stachybotrys chartarum IBT 40288]
MFTMLRKSNFHALNNGIIFKDLPATLADALSIVRSCGFRYIWIDAPCIVQDDKETWLREAGKLPDYFQKAAFVLAAASSLTATENLLRERASPRYHIGTVRFEPRYRLLVDFSLYLRETVQSAARAFEDNALRRMWRLQEIILPRRLLVWGGDQVYWACRTCVLSEGSRNVAGPTWVKYLPPPVGRTDSPNGIPKKYLNWYSFTELFSRAQAMHYQDRLPALEVFVEHFQGQAISSKSVAGLWAADVETGLLWYTKMAPKDGRSLYIAQSWSWLSVTAGISYSLLRGFQANRITNEGHRISVRSQWLSDLVDPTISHRSGPDRRQMELDAMILECLKHAALPDRQKQLTECDYFFDISCEKRFHGTEDVDGGRHLLLFVGPWAAGQLRESSTGHFQCIGLVLFDASPSKNSLTGLSRLGLFLGFRYDGVLDGWTKRSVTIG